MTDLIELVKEFGEIPMGNNTVKNIRVEEDAKFSQFALQPINKHWYKLSKFLNYGPSKMQNFKKIIASAHVEMKTDFEDDRRKTLESFLKKRTKK